MCIHFLCLKTLNLSYKHISDFESRKIITNITVVTQFSSNIEVLLLKSGNYLSLLCVFFHGVLCRVVGGVI